MNLHQQQQAFTSYVRRPQQHPGIEGIAPQRMAVYRELFFNNIKDTLGNAFPVLGQLLAAQQWQTLCEDFFAEHRCHTPYLSHVPGEFVEFLHKHSDRHPPWLLELAQWEWTELELFLAPDHRGSEDFQTSDDPIQGIPLLNPVLRLHAFNYPVHRIGPQHPPGEIDAQGCYLLAWRKPDHSIGFVELNPLSALLMEHLHGNRQHSGYELLSMIAAQQKDHDPETIIRGGSEILHNFYNNNIIIGSLPLPPKETPHE
jgi:hypothetical protein